MLKQSTQFKKTYLIQEKRYLKNFEAKQPYEMSGVYSSALQLNKYWMNKELIDSLKSVTAEKLQAFIDDE